MSGRRLRLASAALAFLACDAAPAASLDPRILTGEAEFAAPAPLADFAPPAGAAAPLERFTGRLKFMAPAVAARVRVLRDRWKLETPEAEYAVPPAFDFGLVQVGEALVPVERGIVEGDGRWWDWVLGPGRAWSEPGDEGWSRASLPFALIEKNANCMHNGVLTFRYRGEDEVSRVAWQVSQETCWYFQFDAWGAVEATRETDAAIDGAAVSAAYRRERAQRLPVKPIAALAEDFPGIDPGRFGSPQDVTPEHMTLYGVLIDGVHYAGGCETRHGPYPHCDAMALPSYSLAKSLLAGFALMRLERLHPGARHALVADHVPECRAAGGWDDVTFEQLLDMASGRWHSTKSERDENETATTRFFLAPGHAEKIGIACTRYPRRGAPGRRWVYHTTDTYILGTAIAAWWRERHGAEADFYRELLVEPLYRRLGLSPEIETTRRTQDGAAQPFTGWGMVLTRDDLVRLGGFLAIGEGRLGEEALLDPQMARAALQRDPADPGLRATDRDFRYNNGFWAWNIARHLGCREPSWIPFLSGFGGLSVVLLPNGIVYYYVSDNAEFRWARAAAEASRLSTVCSG